MSFGVDFGQKVDLTASIRNILRNYPEGYLKKAFIYVEFPHLIKVIFQCFVKELLS